MDSLTKTVAWLFTGLFAGLSLWQMPAEPAPLEAPPATLFEAYEYGEVPAAATSPVEATNSPVETTNPPTTTTEAPKRLPAPKSECNQALQLALDVGWPSKQMGRLALVLWRESRCIMPGKVHNPSDPYGGSYGLMQLNGWWCQVRPGRPVPWLQQQKLITDCTDLYDPETNLRAALAIYRHSGWVPWGYSD